VSEIAGVPPRTRLSVLVVTAQFPYPPRSGFAMRVFQLVQGLARVHDLTLLSYIEPEQRAQVDGLRQRCGIEVEAVEWRPRSRRAKRLAQVASLASLAPYASRELRRPAMQEAIDAVCARTRFDVIQLESSLLCSFDLPPGPRLIIDEHNLESEVHARAGARERSRTRRLFGAIEAARLRRFERACWKRADACIVTSPREEPLIRAHAPETDVAVVPNGVDLDQFRPAADAALPDTAIFNGRLDYRPNLDGASWLVEEIWPRVLERRPGARLAIVGRGDRRDLDRLRSPSVDVTGEVPEVIPLLAAAAVVLVPIRMGGGTRLKVVEGLAMGKAMVSTTLGCEGIDVRDGVHLVIEDDADAFAQAVFAVLAEPERAAMLGRNGRALMEGKYSWELGSTRLLALYARVTA
jgi:glycosyltransferase involved in cell wall biosynthesis